MGDRLVKAATDKTNSRPQLPDSRPGKKRRRGETEVQSEEFTFDDTAPDKLTITLVASNYPPAPGETVIFKVEVEENDSPITGCRLAVGNNPGGKELTSKISGHHDGWLSVPLNRLNKEETIRLTIPGEIPDGDYYPFIEVRNAAGLTSTMAGEAFTVKESPGYSWMTKARIPLRTTA